MAKTLDLFRHSDKDDSGNHISHAGAELAYNTGDDLYNGENEVEISHGFHGPLIRTSETLTAMRTMSDPFANMQINEPIYGLGSTELFKTLVTDEARAAIKNGASNMEAVLQHCDERALADFENGARDAIRQMFDLMEDGQHGVGIFHDPTIPMAAQFFGLEDARSLKSMEAIRFTLDDEGKITASWIPEN